MRLVLSWLREFVDVTASADEIAEKIGLRGFEVASIESLDGGFATVRVKYKTQPLNQGKIANELRRRLMGAFVGRAIKPFA